jgi:hypothetical protein
MNERKRLAEEYVCEVLGSAWCGHARGDECPLCKPRFSAIDAYLAGYSSRDAEVAELVQALEMAANGLEIAATFLEFHGRPSAQLKNCTENIATHAERSREALEKWKAR